MFPLHQLLSKQPYRPTDPNLCSFSSPPSIFKKEENTKIEVKTNKKPIRQKQCPLIPPKK